MKLETLIQRCNGKLSAGDRRIANVLLSSGPASAFLSSHELARLTDLHASSIVRFARKLGYAGFQDLQQDLQRDLQSSIQGDPPAPVRMKERIDRFQGAATLERLVENEIAALKQLVDQVAPERIETLAKAIIQARRIFVFGQGHAAFLADFFCLRLRRSGYSAHPLLHLDWQAADELTDLAAGDLVMAIVLRRSADRLADLLSFAEQRGAATAIIGDLAAISARTTHSLVLAASRGEIGEAQTVVMPLTLTNALILEVSRLDGGHSVRALEIRETTKRHFPS